MKRLLLILPLLILAPQIAGATVQIPQGGGLPAGVQIYTSPGAATFTVPVGVTQLSVLVVGGGGGGGGGAADWGGGGGGGCGGAVAGQVLTVSPGQSISVTVGAGGAGGADSKNNGAAGASSQFGSVIATGGGYGGSGYYGYPNTSGPAGGSGGGSGGGGGGNAYSGFYAVPGSGGTSGSQTNSHGSGGYCTSSGWSVDPPSYVTKVSYSAGSGGYAPTTYAYCGGGGGGGVVLNGTTVTGASGFAPTSGTYGPTCSFNGGAGYGAGGGGTYYSGSPAYGGAGAPGVVYIEWTNNPPTCTISLDQNPVSYGSGTTLHWSSSNTTAFYIDNVGYVVPDASGSAWVQPSSDTDYTGTATTSQGSVNCVASSGTPTGTLNITPPSAPTVTIAASSTSIYTNQSTNILATFAAPSGGSSESSTPTVIFLTSGTSWTVPSDWNSSRNTIEVIGGGGSGGVAVRLSNGVNTGGGGGAYSEITNASLTSNQVLGYQIGLGGAAAVSSGGSVSGNSGGDSFLCSSTSNCSSITGSAVIVGAKGGNAGNSSTGSLAGASGGLASAGIGTVKYSGGSSGRATAGNGFQAATGGGGAAGPHGAGVNGADITASSISVASAGGAADAGFGGSAGQSGSEWDSMHGSGGGSNASSGGNSVSGGLYGAGSGAADSGAGTITSGAGVSGLIAITYYPLTTGTDSLTADNIDSPEGTGLGATTNPDASKTITFSPTQPGTYTFYARAQTSYYPSWTTYATTTITVTQAATCTPSTIYECSGQTIEASSTDAYCTHTLTTVQSCVSPSFCQAGSSSCQYSPILFVQNGDQSGDLTASPGIVLQGLTSTLYWDVENVQSCNVTGSDGEHWSGASSGSTGVPTVPINEETVFTLTCTGLDSTQTSEQATVNIVPAFQER